VDGARPLADNRLEHPEHGFEYLVAPISHQAGALSPEVEVTAAAFLVGVLHGRLEVGEHRVAGSGHSMTVMTVFSAHFPLAVPPLFFLQG
jgi:hypothetical protein